MKVPISLATLTVMMLSANASNADAQSTTVRRPRPPATILTRPQTDSAAIRRIDHRGITTLTPGAAAAAAAAAAPAFQPPPPPPPQVNARKTISRARLDQILGGRRTETIRVVRPSGVTTVATDSVRFAAGDIAVRKISNTAHRIVPTDSAASGADAVYSMPYSMLIVDSAGVERPLVPRFIVRDGAMTYDLKLRKFRGIALVGIEDTLHPGRVPLAQPFLLQLTTTGGSVTPRDLAIDHTSLKYDSVLIESSDSTKVRISTEADRTGFVIAVPVRDMKVKMAGQKLIEGFGLGTTDITLTLPPGFASTDSTTVVLEPSSAPVRPGSVVVRGFGASTVRLRSGLPGPDTINAYIDGVPVGQIVITFKPPWTFLGATLIGIVLGGFARYVSAKRRKRIRALYWDIIKGSPFGVIAAAASAIGLDLVQLKIDEPGTWIAVMITAAIGAWAGARILDRTGPATAPTAAPDQ